MQRLLVLVMMLVVIGCTKYVPVEIESESYEYIFRNSFKYESVEVETEYRNFTLPPGSTKSLNFEGELKSVGAQCSDYRVNIIKNNNEFNFVIGHEIKYLLKDINLSDTLKTFKFKDSNGKLITCHNIPADSILNINYYFV